MILITKSERVADSYIYIYIYYWTATGIFINKYFIFYLMHAYKILVNSTKSLSNLTFSPNS